MPVFYDQLNRAVDIQAIPKRIISIVPSQTELLFYLGLDAEIAGITKFCVHPADKTRLVTKIGGTKQLNLQLIDDLQPDLIIANKEENEQKQVEELMARHPVWISDINDLPSALDMITRLGDITGKHKKAAILADEIEQGFKALIPAKDSLRVAYLIWRKPYMVAGADTYIDAMLRLCGLTNVFEKERYPETTAEELAELNPDVVMLSSEPYPFAQKHIDDFGRFLPQAKIILVDGEMFSWYGSRLLHAPGYFNRLLRVLQ
ncbi:helical backbone metal receptor [Mucilaginibacter glaciei]|uniref:ABC transporter substrate-binding protein n=1 Tax=Mucilaginibacter glaciei TaxID=2772109 RepID=A0A926S4T0_9SPHI|nr:helical backbone metal receptor [Mucilaginibacter glaciei]MBD1392066.1 ABC transporter substrate-binding protein [Mucilaginibacter glaciei]